MFSDGLIAQTFDKAVLPDLPPSLLSSLPPLPPISDPELLRVATTHASFLQKARGRHDLTLAEEIQDYEKLEHVGDAILGSVVTVLLHDLYPNLREGSASVLKDHLVANRTLAQIATAYQLPKKLIAAKSALYSTREQTKTRGSMLEAWVAAVYYSYLREAEAGVQGKDEDTKKASTAGEECMPAHSHTDDAIEIDDEARAATSLTQGETQFEGATSRTDSVEKQCDSPADADQRLTEDPKASADEAGNSTSDPVGKLLDEVAHPPAPYKSTVERSGTGDTRAEELEPTRSRSRTTGDAYLHIDNWLRAVFTPIAIFALDEMRKEQTRLQNIGASATTPEEKEMGAAAFMQVHCSRNHWASPEVVSVRGRGDLWVTTFTVTDGEGKVWTAKATRANKRTGTNAAAYDVSRQMGLLEETE